MRILSYEIDKAFDEIFVYLTPNEAKELVERLIRWKIHPEDLITHRFKLDEVEKAYSLMASGKCGKVAVVFDEEIK